MKLYFNILEECKEEGLGDGGVGQPTGNFTAVTPVYAFI